MSKYVIFPIKNQIVWNLYKKLLNNFWIGDNEKVSGLIYNDNLFKYLIREIDCNEIKFFLSHAMFIESLHSDIISSPESNIKLDWINLQISNDLKLSRLIVISICKYYIFYIDFNLLPNTSNVIHIRLDIKIIKEMLLILFNFVSFDGYLVLFKDLFEEAICIQTNYMINELKISSIETKTIIEELRKELELFIPA